VGLSRDSSPPSSPCVQQEAAQQAGQGASEAGQGASEEDLAQDRLIEQLALQGLGLEDMMADSPRASPVPQPPPSRQHAPQVLMIIVSLVDEHRVSPNLLK
jgi:hypothetical protein